MPARTYAERSGTLVKNLEEVQKAAAGKRRAIANGGKAQATTARKGRATAARKPARQTTRAGRKT
jgi:hypothetical protein